MRVDLETEGLAETIRAFQSLEKDLRKEANGELRAAAKAAAAELVADLRVAAAASGVPVAQRVARSAKVKSDRFPTVVIGGSRKVGRRGAPAGALVWGAEHGGRNFGVDAGGGYWIAPTVARFKSSRAIPTFLRAIDDTARKYGLK